MKVDFYTSIYELMCAQCPDAQKCHEECTECDDFAERLERAENDG